jgi:hypothetical protein
MYIFLTANTCIAQGSPSDCFEDARKQTLSCSFQNTVRGLTIRRANERVGEGTREKGGKQIMVLKG